MCLFNCYNHADYVIYVYCVMYCDSIFIYIVILWIPFHFRTKKHNIIYRPIKHNTFFMSNFFYILFDSTLLWDYKNWLWFEIYLFLFEILLQLVQFLQFVILFDLIIRTCNQNVAKKHLLQNVQQFSSMMLKCLGYLLCDMPHIFCSNDTQVAHALCSCISLTMFRLHNILKFN